MELEIISKKENPLLNRIEVNFKVFHPKEKTPKRAEIRESLANFLNYKRNFVVIDNMKSQFGCPETIGYAKIYPNQKIAKKIEREHVIKRNLEGQK